VGGHGKCRRVLLVDSGKKFYCSVLRPLINLIYVRWTMQEVGAVQ